MPRFGGLRYSAIPRGRFRDGITPHGSHLLVPSPANISRYGGELPDIILMYVNAAIWLPGHNGGKDPTGGFRDDPKRRTT
jgi:hypothetical protein